MTRRPKSLSDELLLQRVAQRLRSMGNPMRLRILHVLEDGEHTVNEIVEAVQASGQTTQANVSKHLTSLRAAGLVTSRRDGMNVFYAVADPSVFVICRTMCDGILRQATSEAKKLGRSGTLSIK